MKILIEKSKAQICHNKGNRWTVILTTIRRNTNNFIVLTCKSRWTIYTLFKLHTFHVSLMDSIFFFLFIFSLSQYKKIKKINISRQSVFTPAFLWCGEGVKCPFHEASKIHILSTQDIIQLLCQPKILSPYLSRIHVCYSDCSTWQQYNPEKPKQFTEVIEWDKKLGNRFGPAVHPNMDWYGIHHSNTHMMQIYILLYRDTYYEYEIRKGLFWELIKSGIHDLGHRFKENRFPHTR